MKKGIVVTWLMGLLILGQAWAGDCRVKDFEGTYAYQGLGTDVANPAAPTPMALSGTLEADGRGGFVFWVNTVSFIPPGGAGKTVITSDLTENAAEVGSVLRYEVDPNCRMRIHGMVGTPFGPRPLEILGGLADGGRSAMMQMGAPTAIGTWTAVRVGTSQGNPLRERTRP